MNNIVNEKIDGVKAKSIDSIGKIDGESLDVVKENVLKLKEIFPEVFCEDKIDFKRLEEVLGEYTDDSDERYRFEWHGKSKAIKIAQTPSRGTLRPCKEESKNWDSTKNLYIEGDNLEVLKLLQKSYQGKIKMIYIDPPYNTGNDFVYPDDYSDNLENYLRITGQKDDEGNKTSTNSEAGGRYHTNWLNMMYPRLRLARNLLSENGFIFISIGEEELDNLKKVCDEIFGRANFRNIISSRRYDKNLNLQFVDEGLSTMNIGLEYILIYSKSEDSKMKAVYKLSNEERANKGYWKGFWNNADRPTMRYELFNYTPIEGQWKWKEEVAREATKNYIDFEKNYADKMTIEEYWKLKECNVRFLRKNPNGKGKNKGVEHWVAPAQGILRNSNWSDILISKPTGVNIPFDSPKNPELLIILCELCGCKNDIVLDFFSGSASIADAVVQYNIKKNLNNNFLLVQLQESVNEKSDAYKEGYKNICEIGKERIRRAGDKIVEENKDKEGIEDLDIGFKVFKLDTSNIKPWNPDYDNIEMTLEDSIDNFVPDRTEEDIVYEIMLKYGIDLTYPVETKEVDGKKIFSIGFGALLVCLDDEITLEIVNEIVKLKEELSPETCRVVFKDNGFKTDSVKTNSVEILKRNNIEEIMSI